MVLHLYLLEQSTLIEVYLNQIVQMRLLMINYFQARSVELWDEHVNDYKGTEQGFLELLPVDYSRKHQVGSTLNKVIGHTC